MMTTRPPRNPVKRHLGGHQALLLLGVQSSSSRISIDVLAHRGLLGCDDRRSKNHDRPANADAERSKRGWVARLADPKKLRFLRKKWSAGALAHPRVGRPRSRRPA